MRPRYLISTLILLASTGSLGASTFNFNAPTGAKDLGGVSRLAVETLFTVNGNGSDLVITSDNNDPYPAGEVEILDTLTSQSGTLNFDVRTFMSLTEAIDSSVAASSQTATGCAATGTVVCIGNTTSLTDTAAVNATSANLAWCASAECAGTSEDPYNFERIAFTAAMGMGDAASDIATTYSTSFTNLMAVNLDGLVISDSLFSPEPASITLIAASLALGWLAFRLRRPRRSA
jgi:hypothetical protein